MGKKLFRPRLLISFLFLALLISVGFGLTACQSQVSFAQASGWKVVATTSLVGDVVSQVGGDKISLLVLLPLGTDPHSFSPTPRDASAIIDADIVFANGVGLEEFLKPLLGSIGGGEKVVEVSQGIKLLSLIDEDSRSQAPGDDPHTWMDPNNILVWVDNIVSAFSKLDPENAPYYKANGRAYQEKLSELDGWIRTQVATIPADNRKIVTEHLIFGYFAKQYGFTQLGAIIPGFSSLAEPSAQDIVQIENSIHSMGVKAIFVNVGVNASIAERIAADTGTKVVFLYMHSLSDRGEPAATYLDFMRFDVSAIVDALR
jgi:ABC-type Zn uptake system ZnuABC Zn-binding protein ZnuA